MSIVIFGDLFTFPDGGAATNRVYTYAKGFLENGINVHVISFSNQYSNEFAGNINGINYYHPFSQKKRNSSFIIRRFQNLLKYRNSYRLIRKINKADSIIAINSWSNLMSTHLFARFLANISHSKLLIECSEHPLRYYESNIIKKVMGRTKFVIETSIADGILCISHFLVDFHKQKGVDNKKLFLIPSTVDPRRFDNTGLPPVSFPFIGYFGSLTFNRDNVDLLIKAFAQLGEEHHQSHLVLGGFCTKQERQQILNLISELKVENKVHLLGFLSRDEIIQYISSAQLLVMVRSNDIHTQASYPSKLTEFLASGRPVISVNVGEISLYLKDGEEVFLVEPGSIQALKEKMEYVLNNYTFAQEVAQKGKKLTETSFNYKYQAKRMIDFITSY